MTDRPLVSICIPSYNGARYIEETIRSVLKQTVTDIEIIVNDDCSKDDTQKTVESIADARIKFFKNEKNLGAVDNCNAALEHARGKYLKVLMQDDLLGEKHLENAIKAFEADSDIRMVTCGTNIIDGSGKTVFVRRHFRKDRVFDGDKYAKRSLRGRNIFCEPSVVCFRREEYDKGLRFDTDFKFDFDWDFAIGAVLGGKIAYLAEPTAYFRVSDTSISGNTYVKNRKTVYDETITLFDKYREKLGLNGLDRLVIKINTKLLLGLKLAYTALTVRRK